MSSRSVVAGLLFALLAISELNADDRPQLGAIEQRGGPVSQDVKLPPLELTNAQRELVRKELLLKHNEVESRLFAMILNLYCLRLVLYSLDSNTDRGVTYDGISKTISHDLDHHDRHGNRDRVLSLRAKIKID